MADLDAALKKVDESDWFDSAKKDMKAMFRAYHGEPEPATRPAGKPKIEVGAIAEYMPTGYTVKILGIFGGRVVVDPGNKPRDIAFVSPKELDVHTSAEAGVGDYVETRVGNTATIIDVYRDGLFSLEGAYVNDSVLREDFTILMKAPKKEPCK